jgi:hypothetical protein
LAYSEQQGTGETKDAGDAASPMYLQLKGGA